MAKGMKYMFPLLLLANVVLGQNVLIKTKHKNYLARMAGNEPDFTKDYYGGGGVPWLQCILKAEEEVAEGALVQKTVPGCGGRLDMNCGAGCIKITKVQYSCTEDNQPRADQLKAVQRRCQDKVRCRVPASRAVFGKAVCPGKPAGQMALQVTYRCNGGKDLTKRKIHRNSKCKVSPHSTPSSNPTTKPAPTSPATTPKPLPPPPPALTSPATTLPLSTFPPSTCSTEQGDMINKDIPLDGGWINI